MVPSTCPAPEHTPPQGAHLFMTQRWTICLAVEFLRCEAEIMKLVPATRLRDKELPTATATNMFARVSDISTRPRGSVFVGRCLEGVERRHLREIYIYSIQHPVSHDPETDPRKVRRVASNKHFTMSATLPTETITKVKSLEKYLGYTFNDSTLAWEAMRRADGKGVMNRRTQKESNKRLALLGDCVIYLVMCREWYPSNETTALFSKMRQTQCSNKFFSNIAEDRSLHTRFMFPQQKSKISIKAVATWVEAVIGAVWLDSGEDPFMVREVLLKLGIMKKEQVHLQAPAKWKRVASSGPPEAPSMISRPTAMLSKEPSGQSTVSKATQMLQFSRLSRLSMSETKAVQTEQPTSTIQAQCVEQVQHVREASLDKMLDDLEERVRKLKLAVKERAVCNWMATSKLRLE